MMRHFESYPRAELLALTLARGAYLARAMSAHELHRDL